MEKGYIHCEFRVSNLPELTNYKILLNHGMNIKYFRNKKGQLIPYNGYYAGKMNGEGLEYYFVNNQNVKINLESTFEIEYSGAFPVYKKDLNGFDFKGYIAVNENTLRATEQSKWYPILYDEDTDRRIDNYTYDITVNTKTSKSVFINGNPPKKGISSVFKSSKAFPLFLFAGDYNFVKVKGNYLINTDVTEDVSKKIFENIDSIKLYYKNLLGTDFKDEIYIINHKAVKDLKNGSWGFNTYPAFGFSNLNFSKLLTKENKFKENRYKFFAHELAHNYFGNNVNSGKLSWFWLEGTAEYLSLVALEDYTNKKNVDGYYAYYCKSIKKKKFIPLNDIKNKKQINSDYRYILGPLIFKSFEISFGRKITINTLKTLLELSKKQTLDIKIWEKSAIKNGVSRESFKTFKKDFLSSNMFKENNINLIRKTITKTTY
ncbi:hypothetical protein BSU00_04340 [Tenacibaculum sp. SG-28]|nr:hypothetical protein BSU00_04340 [Tenacibaculum sp. SG-28]